MRVSEQGDVAESDTAWHRRSPFLVLRWEGTDLVLINCDTLRRFRVDIKLLELLSSIDRWTPSSLGLEFERDTMRENLARLHEIGVVERSHSQMAPPESESYWDPFELLVQRWQNEGGEGHERHGPPPQAFKPRQRGPVVALPPALPLPARLDEVLASRRSIRRYADGPVSKESLSTLLHHSVRVTQVVDSEMGQLVFRPSPTGGARSELELYVVTNRVEGVRSGVYHYDGRVHDLALVKPHDQAQEALNLWVDRATGGLNCQPPVVLIVTAVFGRVMWKYRRIGLSLIYRDVGCLYQTVYLVATALGLAPCVLGAGPELATAAWLGLDPLIESQVGCVLLGPADMVLS